ncbi:MAG TPA: NTP transferase domain-containing protein [Nevskiaceae bacterium]|nr:NTP transferase domain-containing protein [Nevskiaceae bacterium]
MGTRLPVCAVILAGGASQRLGGIDKAWKPLAGEPLLRRVVAQLQPQVERWVLSANRELPHHPEEGWTVIADADPAARAGPLAGMAACSQALPPGDLLFIPVDAWRLPAALLTALAQAAGAGGLACGEQAAGWLPLPCWVAARRREDLLQAWAAGERSPLRWLRQAGAITVSISDAEAEGLSLNTADEWARAERILRA